MLFLNGAIGLAILALWLFCLLDVITTDGADCRNAPKEVWLLVVILVPVIGSILWLIAGRSYPDVPRDLPYKGNASAGRYPEYDRPGRFAATDPDEDEEFLRKVRERAEQQRRAYREQQRREQQRREQEHREQEHREQQGGERQRPERNAAEDTGDDAAENTD
jgi:hypothetical protein